MIIVLNLKRFLLLKTTVYVQSFLARIKDRATSKVATVDQIPSSSHSITLNWKLCYLLESYFMLIFFLNSGLGVLPISSVCPKMINLLLEG